MLKNIKEIHSEASELDGFEDIGEENQAKLVKAWQEEHVDPEDVPESARKPEGEADEEEEEEGGKKKATKKRAPAKAKV